LTYFPHQEEETFWVSLSLQFCFDNLEIQIGHIIRCWILHFNYQNLIYTKHGRQILNNF